MRKLLFNVCALLVLLTSCGKEFLDIKREASQVIPYRIYDYQAILDNSRIMNYSTSFELILLGSDEYILREGVWETANPLYYTHIKNGYVWWDDVYEDRDVTDWNSAYQRILYANMALDVELLKPGQHEVAEWNNVRGQALFYRAFAYYQLVQAFCKPYNPATANSDAGIPIRLHYDLTVSPYLGTVQDVYDQILSDLLQAVELLPVLAIHNYRPSQLAAYALLARIYRELDLWDKTLEAATYVLSQKQDLLDYNEFDPTITYPFSALNRGLNNKEVIFYCHTSAGLLQSGGVVQDKIYQLYEDSDMRKQLFFKSGRFYGSYASSNFFTGLAVDEVLLIRAEAHLKNGATDQALADLKYLWKHRYRDGIFPDIQYRPEELKQVLEQERSKELYMRGVRWSDMRKENVRGAGNVEVVRVVGGTEYRLSPNDPKWVWPWPKSEVTE